MDFDDLEVDDILAPKKKKRVNSKAKGKRGELLCGKELKKRFGFEFSRTLGSGNRWSQTAYLPKHASDTFTGDLVCPENFQWVIEAKDGYDDDIVLHNILAKGQTNAELEKWIKEVKDESRRSGRKPLICWKRKRLPWFCIIKVTDIEGWFKPSLFPAYSMNYGDKNGVRWLIIQLDFLLSLPDEFFFKEEEK